MNSNDLTALLDSLRSTQSLSFPPRPPPPAPSNERFHSANSAADLIASFSRPSPALALASPPPPPLLPFVSSVRPIANSLELDSILSLLTPIAPAPSRSLLPSLPPVPVSPSSSPAKLPTPIKAKASERSSSYRDLTTLSFPEALPLLTSFSQDETFLDQFDDLVRDQERIELGLKDERNRLEREGEEEGGVDAKRLAVKLRKFDLEALERWKELKRVQQGKLQSMGVPTFSVTTEPVILARQARMLTVLLGFLEG